MAACSNGKERRLGKGKVMLSVPEPSSHVALCSCFPERCINASIINFLEQQKAEKTLIAFTSIENNKT